MGVGPIYMTLSGVPVSFRFQWPIQRSGSGHDWWFVHGRVEVEDGGPLHAEVAVNLTQTIKEALPSLEEREAEPVAINAVRKDIDQKQLELVKSGKLQPVFVSSRHYDFKRNRLVFEEATDDEIREMLGRKVYWTSARRGGAAARVADPYDAELLNTTTGRLLELAKELERDGLVKVQGELASATEKLMAKSEEMAGALRRALEELEKKHAFEKGTVARG